MYPLRFLIPLTCALLCAIPSVAADYATYIGDSYSYSVSAIANDGTGNTYATGSRTVVASTPSPLTDVFVTKIDPSGNVTLLATLSGSAVDVGSSIAVDPMGNIYIAGNTTSPDFPLKLPLQGSISVAYNVAQQTGFLAKLSPDGGVLYSTYFGGTNGNSSVNAVATDAQGNAYVTGYTSASDYPRTPGLPAAGAAGPGPGSVSAAFFAKISPAGDKILYAGGLGAMARTCVGGSSCFLSSLASGGVAIAVDLAGNAYIAGNTNGAMLATTLGALLANGVGAFVAKVNSSGTGMVYVTYLGSGASQPSIGTVATDFIYAISADATGNAYLAGYTQDPNFPVTPGAFQTQLANPRTPPFVGPPDTFIAKLNPTGSAMVWATFLGGTNNDIATALAVDPSGGVWVSGTTNSSDFPVTAGVPLGGEFLVEFNSTGSSLLSGSRYPVNTVTASLAIDPQGVVHTAGATGLLSTVTPGATSSARVFGLANAALGNLAGRIAPGEVISIYGLHFGPAAPISASFNSAGFLPTTLGGLQVEIGGVLAPLLYVSDTQINAVVPFELAKATSPTSLTITGMKATPFRLIVDSQIPEVFRAAGGSAAAAINQDGTVNSQANPAKAGSYVSIWATGLGLNDIFFDVDGQQQTTTISDCACFIEDLGLFSYLVPSYAGGAPGMVSGIVQINFQVKNPNEGYTLAGSQNPFSISVVP